MPEPTDFPIISSRTAIGGRNDDGTFIVATMSDPDGSDTTDELRNQKHTVRCVKLRYPSL